MTVVAIAAAATGAIPLDKAAAVTPAMPAPTTPTVSAAEQARTDLLAQVDGILTSAAGDVGVTDLTAAVTVLQAARDTAAADVDPVAAAAALTAAVTAFTTTAADADAALLGTYSDAVKGLEDVLFTATEQLRAATPDTAAAALTASRTAAAAVVADAEAYRAQLVADTAGTNTQPTGGDVDAQLAYLQTYALDYNSAEWGNWNPSGGDCVNFTSQGLTARGWTMDSTWRWSSTRSATKAWVWVPALKWYFDDLGLSYSTEDDLDRVRLGDVGIFDWGENGLGMDHAMTVSKVEYTADGPRVYFVSHNADGQYRELNAALYEEHTDSTVKIFHIP